MINDYKIINKIAKQLYAMDFNVYQDNDLILLSNNQNNFVQFFIQKKGENYFNVIQLKPIEEIAKQLEYDAIQLNNLIYQIDVKDLKQNQNVFVKNTYLFNKQQIQDFFIQYKYGINPNQFEKIFGFRCNSYKTINMHNITILIQNGYQNEKVIDKILNNIKRLKITEKICLIFTNKITQRDGHNIGGNYLADIHGYDAQFMVSNIQTQFDFYHQFGHYYADKEFSNLQLKQIFNFVKESTIFNFKDDYYKTNQNQCFAQLIAHYYTNQLNSQAKKFVQDKILK